MLTQRAGRVPCSCRNSISRFFSPLDTWKTEAQRNQCHSEDFRGISGNIWCILERGKVASAFALDSFSSARRNVWFSSPIFTNKIKVASTHLTWIHGFLLSLRCSQRGTRSKILFENENYVGVQLFCELLGPLPTGQAHSASCSCLCLLRSLPDFHLLLTSPALGLPLNLFPGLRPQDVRKVACSGLAACPCQALSGLPVLFRFSVLCWFFLT